MKTILSIFAALAVAGGAYAGCGKKVTDAGTLKSYDAETKSIVVAVDDKEVTLTVTPTTVAKDKEGAEATLEGLVGKTVNVISEHKKVDSVTEKEAKAS